MKVQFLGAAQTVTGSCYMLEACGARFTIDCGMHQGNKAIEKRNYETGIYNPAQIDFILLTHAHIDHSGLLPRIAREGFKKAIYCTEPTVDLLGLMLLDSAHIQETEAQWENHKLKRHGVKKQIEPLYTVEDAQKVVSQLKAIQYNTSFEPHPGIKVTYRDAGHIIGSAFIELEITENDKTTRLVFSGDLGRANALLMSDPEIPHPADYLFVESTYGNRDHKDSSEGLDELAEAIAYSYNLGQKVIIPAFAVERTQEILYTLHILLKQGRLPADMPIFVDSPLAIRATEVFRKHPNFLDAETHEFLGKGEDPLQLPNLRYSLDVAESQAINSMPGSAIVISASGMCNAGRIKHHLRHNLWKPGASIVFVGYQGMGTPGRKIVDGAKSIRLFNEDIAVAARLFTIGGFSAHAGQSQILEWIKSMATPQLKVVLVHGEEQALSTLSGLVQEKMSLNVHIAAYLEELELLAGTAPEQMLTVQTSPLPRVDWELILTDTDSKMRILKERITAIESRPWVEQTELRDRMIELNREMLSILSGI